VETSWTVVEGCWPLAEELKDASEWSEAAAVELFKNRTTAKPATRVAPKKAEG
jgi:hypothetical protein